MKTIKTLTVAAITASIFLTSCDKACIKGSGTVTTETLTIAAFTGVELGGAFDVNVSQGATQQVTVTGHQNIIDKLEIDVHSGLCEIRLEDGCYKDYDMTFDITVPEIEKVYLSGSGAININDFVDQNDLDVRISGSGDIFLNEFDGCENLTLTVSGSGDIFANDDLIDVTDLNINISGSGTYDGYAIERDDCDSNVAGSGECKVSARNNLNVTISGSGDVYYRGNPTISTNISGSGNIINAN